MRTAETSSQDGGIGKYTLLPLISKRRTTKNLKTKKHPELPENRTVWKSNNQGVKETFIQTGRRGGEGKPGWRGLTARQRTGEGQGGSWWTGQSLIHLQISQEEQLGSDTDHATQVSSAGKYPSSLI